MALQLVKSHWIWSQVVAPCNQPSLLTVKHAPIIIQEVAETHLLQQSLSQYSIAILVRNVSS